MYRSLPFGSKIMKFLEPLFSQRFFSFGKGDKTRLNVHKAQQNELCPVFRHFSLNRSIKLSSDKISLSGKDRISSIAFCSSAGFFICSSKNALGVTPRYSHIYRNSVIEGKERPLEMLWI